MDERHIIAIVFFLFGMIIAPLIYLNLFYENGKVVSAKDTAKKFCNHQGREFISYELQGGKFSKIVCGKKMQTLDTLTIPFEEEFK